ncbi:BolA family protein [Otariodibacter oris]|uniref:BolA protein n=1 Tax=Otariodibacter oris TaxID=1032623 RepID=A0A420XH97_9PAST|nr:BolA/IbaG family iron-sulfur metabolism protein [Otariodibacter oris]QGM81096.1 transcriptional regulator [Otariodibacter oris]RKR76717.1 BolA protein [Otariodibacter oris]
MSIENSIITKLTENFNPIVLHVENESHNHHAGKGAESHFKVTLVSSTFDSMRTIARHRAIYTCLADELNAGVHALALHTYTELEWQNMGEVAPKSPNCMGHGQ